MINKISSLLVGAMVLLSFTACLDAETPNTERYTITAPEIKGTAISLLELKQRYQAPMTGRNESAYLKVDEDVVIEGVVVANDISGNLYQTLVIRQIGSTPLANDDQSIQIGIKHTTLYPYFQLGQKIRVNLKNLYVGNYSNTPKIGEPYRTSSGNLRLGPILFERVGTNIQLVGAPNPNAPELTPIDLTTAEGEAWLKARANLNYLRSPMLVTVQGTFKEMQGAAKNTAEVGELSLEAEPLPKIFAPEALYDAGYAVNRNLLTPGGYTITLRTSTQNDISFLRLPEDSRRYTGVLTFFTTWQLQLRTASDINPSIQ